MQRVFQRFVDRLNESYDREGFHQAMAETAIAFDLPCFAYLTMPRRRKAGPELISNYPLPWTDYYLKAHYEKLDPVIVLAHRQSEPFEWGMGADTLLMSTAQEKFFEEAAQFGIRSGFTVPIQYDNEPVAAVTFASDDRRVAFQHTIKTNRRVLQLMAISLHAHARWKLFHCVQIGDVKLTVREVECLNHAAQGKSQPDIAAILGLSSRGVKFHLDNVRHKLGVRTICQAAVLLAKAQADERGSGSSPP
ncbi:MAG: LuxR family transcriptional regulator [Alphaproteobacteria bacterium]|nr:LuxR family transcriptional regulator [Alphaproteobacteria bacterium]MDE2493075.1 LuxR family transcriptional regulator [Alphaproteobacteria bacterium]